MTFSDVFSSGRRRRGQPRVPSHEHDGSELSGVASFLTLKAERILGGVIQGADFVSDNWDGARPPDLTSPDLAASQGFALDGGAGAAQFEGNVFVGASSANGIISIGPVTGKHIQLHPTLGMLLPLSDTEAGTIDAAAVYAAGSSGVGQSVTIEGPHYLTDSEFTASLTLSRPFSGNAYAFQFTSAVRSGTGGAETYDNFVRIVNSDLGGSAIAVHVMQSEPGELLRLWDIDGTDREVVTLRNTGGTTLSEWRSTGHWRGVDGSAALPSYASINDVDTGAFFPAANEYGISTGATRRVHVTNSQTKIENLFNLDGNELTISGGAVTATKSYHQIDTEADAATDELDTINGGTEGDLLLIRTAASTRDVTVKDGTGNLRLAGDFTLTDVQDAMLLFRATTVWIEVSRSDNS